LIALAVTLLGGLGTLGLVYALVLRPRQQAHHEAVSRVALREVLKSQDDFREHENAVGRLTLGSPLFAYCADILAADSQGNSMADFTAKMYGKPDETAMIAARACAETAMKDAEKIVALSEAYGK
jgi:hypothetical protein